MRAISFTVWLFFFAASTRSFFTPRIPSIFTSPITQGRPSTPFARITILVAVSMPSTSADGSASA